MEPLFNEGGSLHFLTEKIGWARYYYGIMEGNKDCPGRSSALIKSRRRTGKLTVSFSKANKRNFGGNLPATMRY